MSIHFVDRVRRFAGRLFRSTSRRRRETHARNLRVEPLEQRRLLSLPSLLVGGGSGNNIAAYYGAVESNGGWPCAGNFERNFATTSGSNVNGFPEGLPVGLAFGPYNNLYVDTAGEGVQVFNGQTGTPMGTYVVPNSTYGTPGGAIAFGPDGDLYIGYHNGLNGMAYIVQYSISTASGSVVATPNVLVSSNTPTNGTPRLFDPVGLAFGPDGNLYVADAGTGYVDCYAGPASATPGQFLKDFAVCPDSTTEGSLSGGIAFGGPWGLSYGNFYVAGYYGANGWVQEYNIYADNGAGRLEGKVIGGGVNDGGLGETGALAFSGGGGSFSQDTAFSFLYVVDYAHNSVKCYEDFMESGGADGADFVNAVTPSNAGLSGPACLAFANIVSEPPIATVLTLPDQLIQTTYGDTVSLTPNLAANGIPLPNEPVAFYINGAEYENLGTYTTDANGNIALSFNSADFGESGVVQLAGEFSGDTWYGKAINEINMVVGPATPTVSVTDAGGTYTGQAFPATGTVAGVDGASLGTPTFQYYSGTYATPAALDGLAPLPGAPANVGAYTVLASYTAGTSPGFPYTSASAMANFRITACHVTVTAAGETKPYDGTVAAAVTLTVNGGPGTLTANYTTATYATPNTGVNILVSISGITLGGPGAANFTANSTASTSGNITPAPLTITANDQGKVYGAALPALTVSYYGFVDGQTPADLATLPMIATTATAASHVSDSPYPITASGAADPNYTIGYVAGTLTVTPAPLTITANNQTKVYGSALPALTASYAGLVNGDTPASLATQPTLTTTATAASHVVGSPYGIAATGAVDPDYTIGYVAGMLTVTPAPLTITANNQTKVYGAALPALTASYAGFVNGDTPASLATQPTLTTTATAASHVAGNPYRITATAAADPDYTIGYLPGTLTVTPAPLTITANNQTKVYGAALPALTASYAGLVNGDTAASLATRPALSTTATAASHVAGNPYRIMATGAADPDYTIGYVAGTLTVTPAPLTITANNQTKVYGAALPALTASYAGLVNGDTAASLATRPTLTTTATAASHVAGNPYSIAATGAADPDYTIGYVAGTLTVTPAPLTITANNQIMLTGKPVPALTTTYAGLVNGDTPASLASPPQLSTPATSQSLCGQYPINISGAADADYTITQTFGTLWIITAVGQAIWVPVDPINPTKSLLIVAGTAANDVIQINPGSTAGSVTVIFDGKSLGTFNPTSRICIYGGGGNDTVSVSQKVTLPTWLYAEYGNAQLLGGGGPTLLVGGPGKDTLWGGSGPTIMIGASGNNSLLAGPGDAVLIGGTTAYDDNSVALQQILGTWSSSAGYAARVSQLMSDPTCPLDAATVFAPNTVDSLFGGSGMGLFFQGPADHLQGVRPGETVVAVA